MGITKMADVVSLLPWVGKKKTAPPEPDDETASTTPVTDEAEESVSKTDTRRMGEISLAEFEAMQCRIEVAKKIAEVREAHAGINRNRVKRLLRIAALVVLGAFLVQFSPLGTPKVKLPIDKITLGTAMPIAAFAGGKERVGHIAILKVSGAIGGSLHDEPDAGNTPLYLATALATAEADPDLAAVIIEIDSPGGSSVSSAQAYRIVKAARERLGKRNVRVVAYTSQGAYSGGYYIAMGVGHGNFFADPLADVANIGTIMVFFNTAGVGEFVGVTENIISTGPLKSTGHQWEKLTPPQRAMLQESVNDSFMDFLAAVSEGRGIDMETLVQESQLPLGRTNGAWFSAKRAVAKGLLDGVIPIESLYVQVVGMLLNKEEWSSVSLVEYRAHTSALDDATKKAGHATGMFLQSMLAQMTHRDAPMRSEKP